MDNRIFASTGVKNLLLPPTNLKVTQSSNDLGVFVEEMNTVSWDASVDPKVVGYLIYRNGVFLDSVEATTTQYVDDNQEQSCTVIYGVAAVDDQKSHSVIVKVSSP